MNSPSIDILLAAYNAEKYLAAQVDSVVKQTYGDVHLLIRDDGSTDGTRRILASLKDRYPEKITLADDALGNVGACGNFALLLAQTKAAYVMFCDQDDVWLPDKVEKTLRKMRELEEEFGDSVPLLVHTDMKVVDSDLAVKAGSYWRYQAFDPRNGSKLNRMLVSNVVIGCTLMMNEKLRDLAAPVPPGALMHDWWIALLSAALGKSAFLEDATVLYRQHGKNVIGASWDLSFGGIMNKLLDMRKHKQFLIDSQRQAGVFVNRYRHLLSDGDVKMADAYANLHNQNWLKKRWDIVKYGFWWSGLLRNAALLILV
jgi:glycosyltransferase involved in cell wall biosynthesis